MTFDLPGHGDSARIEASLEETADLVVQSLPDAPVLLGGYSYGARVALHVAIRHQERVDRLALISASRGIEDSLERAARIQHDRELAERIETIGAAAFLDEWLNQPMFKTLPRDEHERAARCTDARGMASSLRHSGTGTQHFLGPVIPTLSIPVLCVAGARDAKFTREARSIAELAPRGKALIIKDAGHATHLEKPRECAHALSEFFRAPTDS